MTGDSYFVQIKFTCDGSYLVGLSDGVDPIMYYFDWFRSKILNETKATNPPEIVGPVTDMALNPVDPRIVCFVGKGLFRLMVLGDLTWKQFGFQKADKFDITTACWVNGNRILAGTSDCRLVLVDEGDLKAVFIVQTLLDLDLTIKLKNPADVLPLPVKYEQKTCIKCCVSFEGGLLFVVGDFEVYYFELMDGRYRKRTTFTLENRAASADDESMEDQLNVIDMICLNVENDTLACVTGQPQLYWAELQGNRDISVKFKPLGATLHHGPICGLSPCKWKSFFLTCGMDRTVKVWNYLETRMVFSEQFDEDVLSISCHPTGLYCVTALRSKVVFQLIHPDCLVTWREFPIANCSIVRFSVSGHLFAIVNQLVVEVYCSVTFQQQFTCTGHTDKINGMEWASHDWKLYTCGRDGAIYHFNLFTNEMVLNILQTQEFKELTVSKDSKQIFPTSDDGRIREIYNNTVIRNKALPDHLPSGAIALSRSDAMIFYATPSGVILSLMLPITNVVKVKEFSAHNRAVTKLRLSIDDTMLFSVSDDGSVCIWDVSDARGMMAHMSDDFTYSEELLLSSLNIKENIDYIEHLKNRVNVLKRQRTYVISELEKHKEKQIVSIKETHAKRLKQLETEKENNTNRFDSQINTVEAEINKVREANNLVLEMLDSKYGEALLVEYEKYAALEEKLFKVNDELTVELNQLLEKEIVRMKEIQEQFARNLAEKEKIAQAVKDAHNIEKQEVYLKIDEIEDDNDRNNLERDVKSITKMKQLKKVNARLTKELDVYRVKAKAAIKKTEDYSRLVAKYIDDIEITKDKHKAEEKLIEVQQAQLQVQKETITRIDKAMYEGKLKMARLDNELMILKINKEERQLTIEPLEIEMGERNKSFEGIGRELEDRLRLKKRTELIVREQRDMIKHTSRELKKKKITIQQVTAFLRNARIDIHYVYEHSDNQAKLKETVKKMFHKYDTGRVGEGANTKEGAFTEMFRQREFLERSLASLRNRMAVCDRKVNSGHRVVEDNIKLLETVNKLRRDLVVNRSKYLTLQRVIGAENIQLMTPTQAKEKLEEANNNVAVTRVDYKGQIRTLKIKLMQLQAEMTRIKMTNNF
ncbi:cilia- and flagella-associated protein 57-like [Adelges cooleyi]|uniref:cilia- and flagella-associated protein 57-like n=1 Tax=Adelges cooleyi TaxID=133065 RepID=UPI00217F27D3|nr:cilia- and flagella-associated protein 57-like [Adelges cooleyi]